MDELYLYDPIEPGTSRPIIDQLAARKGPVTLRINSPGGCVSEGFAIINAMQRHGQVSVEIDGIAASIASAIAVSGRRVSIAENALLMIHAPWMFTEGNADELRRNADTLDKFGDQLRDIYIRKSGASKATVERWMAGETWFTADEALTAGLVDEIAKPLAIAASMRRKIHTMGFVRPPQFEDETMSDTTPNDKPQDTPTARKPDLHVVETVMAAERQRRTEIRARFQPLLNSYPSRNDLHALLDTVLDDPGISVQAASDRLMQKLGEGCESLVPAGWNADPTQYMGASWGGNRHHSDFRAAAIDALLIRGGINLKNPHPAARDFRGYSIVDLARARLSQFGKSTSGMSRSDVIQAALTSSDLPELLANVASKSVMNGFSAEHAVTHTLWTQQSTLMDFKTAKRVALSEAPGLLEVKERGEYLDGSLDDAAESISLKTYGRIVSLSRQMLVNDDLGELTRVPEAMGMAARRTESDIVYTLLTGNPSMRDGVALFHADHGNLVASGSGAAPSVASLGVARAAMKRQRGLAGESFLNIEPRFLIVPVELESVTFALTAAITPFSVDEAVPEWIKQLTIVSDPRLDESSTTAWYLAADPMLHSTIDVAHLDGEPVFLDQQNGFATDDLRLKVRLDVGAAAVDWRGLFMNAGA